MTKEEKKYITQLHDYLASLNNSLEYSLANIRHFRDEIDFIKRRIAYEKRCVTLITSNIANAKKELNKLKK